MIYKVTACHDFTQNAGIIDSFWVQMLLHATNSHWQSLQTEYWKSDNNFKWMNLKKEVGTYVHIW